MPSHCSGPGMHAPEQPVGQVQLSGPLSVSINARQYVSCSGPGVLAMYQGLMVWQPASQESSGIVPSQLASTLER